MSLTTDNPQATPILQDPVSLAGVPIHKVLEGDAAAAKNSLPALIGKDPSGNLQFIRLSANSEVIVKNDSAEVAFLSDQGKVAGNKDTAQIVATIPLQVDTEYRKVGWIVACFRQAEFEIVQKDDATETVLATILVGPNQYTHHGELEGLVLTSGATGTQEIFVRGINFESASDLRATISVTEIQVA